jgi:hypothetical protein
MYVLEALHENAARTHSQTHLGRRGSGIKAILRYSQEGKEENKIHNSSRVPDVSWVSRFVVFEIFLDGLLLVGRHSEVIAESPTAEDNLLARGFWIRHLGAWIYLRCSYRGDIGATRGEGCATSFSDNNQWR